MSAYLTGCPQFNGSNLDISSHWYNPAESGFGYSFQVYPNYEFVANFLYDGQGISRFLVAERAGTYPNASETFNLDQIGGFCPLCTAVATTRTTVGTFSRTYTTNNISSVGTSVNFANGVTGSWNKTSSVAALTETQGCAP